MVGKHKDFREYRSYALVTGAASGMGRLYARHLAMMGYNLVIVDINAQKLDAVTEELRSMVSGLDDWRIPYKSDFTVLPFVCDLSRPEAAEKIHLFTDSSGCDVEVLVNNAGLFYYQGIAETSPAALSRMVMVHNYTPLLLCRAYVPGMRSRGCGYVLNVSSLAAWIPWPGLGMYASTKRFVKDFSRALRVECRGTGVSVTNAYFGAVDTPLFNLRPSYRKLARNLRIMVPAEKAVEKAMKATFSRKKGTMPGLLNHIFKPVAAVLPDAVLAWIYRLLASIRMDI